MHKSSERRLVPEKSRATQSAGCRISGPIGGTLLGGWPAHKPEGRQRGIGDVTSAIGARPADGARCGATSYPPPFPPLFLQAERILGEQLGAAAAEHPPE